MAFHNFLFSLTQQFSDSLLETQFHVVNTRERERACVRYMRTNTESCVISKY